MKKTVIVCDKCKKEIPEDKAVDLAGVLDICPACWLKLRGILLEWVNKQEAAAPAPKPPDTGKMQALRDAGWTIAAIAREMHTSASFVTRNTKPQAARKKSYPLESTGNALRDPGPKEEK